MTGRTAIGMLALVALVACSGDRGLRVLENPGAGPDEFSVVPVRPLELPTSTALPPPTPGGTNRADPAPLSEAAAALGGAAAFSAGGIPASDAALVAQASRSGRDPAIRQTLAAEDAAFRRRANALGGFNLFGRDRYFRAYARQALDAYAELTRFRNLGVGVPSAPPPAGR